MKTARLPTRFVDVVITPDAWADEGARQALIESCGIPTVERWVVTGEDERGSRIVRVFGR